MLLSPKEYYSCIDYLFTKFVDSEEERENILSILDGIYNTLENEGSFGDSNFKALLEVLGEWISDLKNINILEPLNNQKRSEILDKLIKGEKIKEPKEAFQMSISTECHSAMSNQAQFDLQNA